MKKISFIIIAIVLCVNANAQQRKSSYKYSDIEGIWLVTAGYNENEKEWQPLSDDGGMVFAFVPITTQGKRIAMLNNSGGLVHFTYKLANNTIRMYDIGDPSKVVITISILSVVRGQNFIGRMSTMNSDYSAKFMFIHIDE